MSRLPVRHARGAMGALAAVVAGCVLAGCTASPTAGVTSSVSTPVASSPGPSPTSSVPAAPVLHPEGAAADNLPLFAAVTATVWSTPENGLGRSYIDALTAAGFDRSAMQVTNDLSTVGNPAESLQFSVRWGDECLIGQVGAATGSPVTVIAPVLAGGACLLGVTRPIDW